MGNPYHKAMESPLILPGCSQGNKGPYLGDKAYALIYEKIVHLEYKPGKVLIEKDLMADLGLGRTPVREAVKRLSAEGIIEIHSNNIAVVRPITLQNTKALFTALELLEQAVGKIIFSTGPGQWLEQMEQAQEHMRQAAAAGEVQDMVLANQQFHSVFHQASNNFYMIHALKPVIVEMERLTHISFRTDLLPDQPLEVVHGLVLAEHDRILQCLRSQDQAGLLEALRDHHATFRKRIIAYLSS